MNEADLIEAVTREVLAALSSGDPCEDCHGSCAAHSPDRVRSVVANGADRVSYRGGGADVPMDLARYIDHTLLKPDTTAQDIDVLCAEAKEYGFASVCVNPAWVKRASANLRGTDVRVASVVGFPFGAIKNLVATVLLGFGDLNRNICAFGDQGLDFFIQVVNLLPKFFQ